MSLLSNLRKRGFKDIFNPKKWGIFGRYLVRRAMRKQYPELSNTLYLEQIVYRMTREGCQQCILAGECVHCGCISPQLFYDKDNWCSGMHWNEMFDNWKAWNEFKTMNGIVISEEQVKQVRDYGRVERV